MKDKGQISFSQKSDDTIGIDLSEMIRVFDAYVPEQQKSTKRTEQDHDVLTENFYLKKQIEALTRSLEISEARVDQMIICSLLFSKLFHKKFSYLRSL